MADTISDTITTIQEGSTLDAVFLGDEDSGTFKRIVIRNVILSFDSTPGSTSIQEGRVNDVCYSITTQQHTLNWSATIYQTITLVTTTFVAKFLKKNSDTLLGAGLVLGVLTGGASILLEGTALALITGITAVVSGTGGVLGKIASTETKVMQETFNESGSKAFTSYVVRQINCRPEHGDIELPEPASQPGLAEQEAARGIFDNLGQPH